MQQVVSLSEAFDLAVERQHQLDLAGAIAVYRAILAARPDQDSTLYNLFSVLLSCGEFAQARALIDAQGPLLGPDPAVYARVVAQLEAEWAAPLPQAGADWAGTVILPTYNAAGFVTRALDSIARATGVLRARHPRLAVAVVVVDDASADDTVAVCRRWAAGQNRSCADGVDLQILTLGRNGGPATARNAGARLARGGLLWFLDADDEFLPEHLLTTYDLMAAHPTCGFVRTLHHFEGINTEVQDGMRLQNMLTSSINLCIRRACHDFIGGQPEETIYRRGGGEDASYSEMMSAFFLGVLCHRETVVYRWRPGNSLDEQAERFVHGDRARGNRPQDDKGGAQLAGHALTARRMADLDRRVKEGALPLPPGLPPLRAKRWPRECLRVS